MDRHADHLADAVALRGAQGDERDRRALPKRVIEPEAAV